MFPLPEKSLQPSSGFSGLCLIVQVQGVDVLKGGCEFHLSLESLCLLVLLSLVIIYKAHAGFLQETWPVIKATSLRGEAGGWFPIRNSFIFFLVP